MCDAHGQGTLNIVCEAPLIMRNVAPSGRISFQSFQENDDIKNLQSPNSNHAHISRPAYLYILRVHFMSFVGNLQQSGWQKNQHFACFPYLRLCPSHWALRTNLVGNHGVHDDVKAVTSEAVHNRGHVATESIAFRVITTVEEFCWSNNNRL